MRLKKNSEALADESNHTHISNSNTASREGVAVYFAKNRTSIALRVGLILVLLAAVIAGGFYLKQVVDGGKIELRVGTYQYTKKQYSTLIKQASQMHVTETTARAALIDSMAARAAADKLGLTYPAEKASQDNAARARYDLLLDSDVSDFQRATSWATIIEPYLAVSEVGGYKTAAVYFPFSRYITGFQKSYLTATFDDKLTGNKDAIKQDIAYARQQADAAITAYTNKTKTIDQIIAEVLADPRLRSYGLTANKSGVDLIGLDQQRYTGNRSVLLRHAFYQNVEKSAQNTGRPELFEDRIDDNYGLNMPEIDRPDDETAVGYYFLVTEKIPQRTDLATLYEKTVKEYHDAAY